MKIWNAAVAGLIALALGNAQAALVSASDSEFSWTTDTATGLDWLSFDGGAAPSTILRSKDDVTAQLGVGGEYGGWRFAFQSEVYQFILNATGFPYLVAAPGASTINIGATDLVAAWTGYTGMDGPYGRAGGFTVEGYAILFDLDPSKFENSTVWVSYYGALNTNESYQDFGSWLVRGGSDVPEPTTLALLGLALAGLGLTRRRNSLGSGGKQ